MSAISAYARALAVSAGQAQPVATRRHVHIAERPMVFVPLTLAGEANAPLACLVGSSRAEPSFHLVPNPRDRDQRFAFAAELADIVLPYVESFTRTLEMTGADRYRFLDAPQLLLPNAEGLAFTRLFGRSTRFRRTTGPYPVKAQVPMLGRWLTYFAERAEHPGSSTTLAMTGVLGLHWATGQSALEDGNLATLLAWIAPPAGVSGSDAALLAEDPVSCPPAGPTTDPTFDNEVLAPLLSAYRAAPTEASVSALESALRSQLTPTWQLMWDAVELLRTLEPGESVADRWGWDRQQFTDFHKYVADGGFPQARRDGAVAAAYRLGRMEREQADYDAGRALDDPLVMAAYRVTGEAFCGVVESVDQDRRVPNDKGNLVTRPLVVVRSSDPLRLNPGAKVVATSRRKQSASIVSIMDGLVTLEISSGMGRAKVPPPGAVPEVGERLCYTSVIAENIPAPALPRADETPWTHGGPPAPYVPTDDDAREVWE